MSVTLSVYRIESAAAASGAARIGCGNVTASATHSGAAPCKGYRGEDITGSWRVRIVGGTGTPPLPIWYGALATFTRDGCLVATIRDSSISTGHGAWIPTKRREFAISIELLLFNAAGDFAGTLRSTATLRVGKDGSTFTSDDYAFESFDITGNPTGFAGVGQALGTRLTVG